MSKNQKTVGLDKEVEARCAQGPATTERAYALLQPNTESLVGRAYGIAFDIDTLASHTRNEVQYLRNQAAQLDCTVAELKALANSIRNHANDLEFHLTK